MLTYAGNEHFRPTTALLHRRKMLTYRVYAPLFRLPRALYSNEIARFRGLGLALIFDTFCSYGIACFRGLALIFDTFCSSEIACFPGLGAAFVVDALCLPEIACLQGLGGDLVVAA